MIYLDAIVVKVRDGGHVRNKAAHIAVGVDLDGIKHVLGIWVQATEGAKFWASVCAELANRGVRDVLIVCCDGLTGFPEAIEATWPRSDRADLCRAPHPSRDAVRELQGPQSRRRGVEADLPGRQRRRRARSSSTRSRRLRSARSTRRRSRRSGTPGNGSRRSWRSRRRCAG